MFQSDYRREMDRLTPSRPALEKLDTLLAEGTEVRRPRRLGRRAAIAAVLCAALAVTAAAAGPTVWQTLTGQLGPFAPYAAPAQGAASDQGVEVALAGSLSDGHVAKVYFTVTDPAGRLNEHTAVTAQLETAEGIPAGGSGCRVLSLDKAAGQLLVEASLEGENGGDASVLTVTRLDPGCRYMQDARFQPPEAARALESETLADGQTVLRAGQTPQTSPDTADFSISSMGFDSQGRFHIRLAMAEGYANEALLAVPYNAEQEQMGSTLDQFAVDGGVDCVIGGITPADVADMESIRVYGAYRGPEAAIQGTWTLPVTLEPAEQRTITLNRQVWPYRLDALELSPLSVTLTWRRLDGQPGHPGIQVTLRDGNQAGLEVKGGSGNPDHSYDFWLFTEPVELDDISSVTIAGETFPLE